MARQRARNLTPVPFAVDAALLRELGERLVGRSYIALAELIKNSYDADASIVEVTVAGQEITVADDGHGMTKKEFRDRWMRIGSPHKERQKRSRSLKRPLTGSKGIGRLSAQFLARELRLWAQADGARQVFAEVDWPRAQRSKLITRATALVGTAAGNERQSFPRDSSHGMIIELGRLNQEWQTDDLEGLAREVWMLQPPFSTADDGFVIKLIADDPATSAGFDQQIRAYLDVYYARIKGELVTPPGSAVGLLSAELTFSDGEKHILRQEIDPCRVAHADVEIRVYHLQHRQPRGLTVGDMRAYFNKWGGVHVYDAGFHLPYYGPDEDWLGIEIAHSHRLSSSGLLPKSERVAKGLQYLPTNSRLFGEVRVSTSEERRSRRKASPQDVLQIQASRDRLVDNRAFDDLQKSVRTTLDWYAMREAARAAKRAELESEPERVTHATERLLEVVEDLRDTLADADHERLARAVQAVERIESAQSAERDRQLRLMATLASAGASSLAYEHEVGKQLSKLRSITHRLKRRAAKEPDLAPLSSELADWVRRAQRARGLFSPLLDEEEREQPRALPARAAIHRIVEDLDFLLGGVKVEIEVDPELRLPRARLAEWSAIFQNAFTNARAAMRRTRHPRILISAGGRARNRWLTVQDTGIGIDLTRADHLFEPFERGDPREVGPGTGLGLAIVRMLANSIGVRTAFVEPDEGWATSLRLSWTVRP